jgi:hypothetical protein
VKSNSRVLLAAAGIRPVHITGQNYDDSTNALHDYIQKKELDQIGSRTNQ